MGHAGANKEHRENSDTDFAAAFTTSAADALNAFLRAIL
jgi:hypothetical protein